MDYNNNGESIMLFVYENINVKLNSPNNNNISENNPNFIVSTIVEKVT